MNENILPGFKGEKIVVRSGGTVLDAVDIVRAVAQKSQEDKFFLGLMSMVDEVPKSERLETFCDLLFKNATFESDPLGHQRIRTPRRLFFDGRGNCIDYSTAIAAYCIYYKIPCILRLVSWSEDSQLSHIYPVINGVPYDLVQGQDQKGQEFFKRQSDRVMKIGVEKPYSRKTDISL